MSEAVLDPLNLIPFGFLASKGAKAAAVAAKATQLGRAPSEVQKLVKGLELAAPLRKAAQAERKITLKQQTAVLHGLRQVPQGRDTFIKMQGSLRGRQYKRFWESPEINLTSGDETLLFDTIAKHPFKNPWDTFDAQKALNKLLYQAPEEFTKREQGLLENIFGIALPSLKDPSRWDTVWSALNLPRALLASFDISFPLRQGVMLIGHPKEFVSMWAPMIKAFGKQKWADDAAKAIKGMPEYDDLSRAGLEFIEEAGPLAARPEEFMTQWASLLPGIKQSQRAFITAGNKLRYDTAANIVRGWPKNTPFEKYELLAKYLNAATGRGDVGFLKGALPALNAGFFAPRLLISRFQVPIMLARSKGIRGIIARDLVAFTGTGSAALWLLKQAGAEVELDPRSGDFGKYRIGNVRGDFWGGYQQIARYTAQLMTGQRKTTGAGRIVDVERFEILGRFLRSKTSPPVGLGIDILKGETFLGEELTIEGGGLVEQAWNRLAPLFIQDLTEAIYEDGTMGGLAAAPGVAGVSVVAFRGVRDVQNEEALNQFGRDYEDLNQGERRTINDTDEVKAALDDMEAKAGDVPIREQVQAAYGFYQERTTTLEAELRTKIDAGIQGVALKEAVQEFKQMVWSASQTVFTDEITTQARQTLGVPIEDVFATAYWAAPLPENLETGEMDFRAPPGYPHLS